MYADKSLLYEKKIFGGVFNEWRVKRVNKLEYIFSQGWFQNKKVLELGCAFGNIGLYLKSLGAEVTFADARQEALDAVRRKDAGTELILLDQEQPWSLDRKFDLILHFGLLYNLDNWEADLRCTIPQAQFTALETAVARYTDDFECKIVNPHYPYKIYGPNSGTGTLVSSSNIENVLCALGTDFHRYDDSDLNMRDDWDDFCYDWVEEEGPLEEFKETPIVHDWGSRHLGGRRFWIIRNNAWTQ